MPFVANKKMTLAGAEYFKGQQIPTRAFHAIASHRQGALLRTRLVLEVAATPAQGDFCPHCESGPYSRLAQHISLKHPDLEPDLEEE